MQLNGLNILWAILPLQLQMMDVPAEVALEKKQIGKKKALPARDTLFCPSWNNSSWQMASTTFLLLHKLNGIPLIGQWFMLSASEGQTYLLFGADENLLPLGKIKSMNIQNQVLKQCNSKKNPFILIFL